MKFEFKVVDRGFDELKKLAGQKGTAKVGIIGAEAGTDHGAEGWESCNGVKRDAQGRFLKGSGARVQHDHVEGEITTADLAVIHEFGTDKIPERSFIRSSFDANREKYLEYLKNITRAVYDRRMTLRRGLGLLGQMAASDTREKIRSGIPPPNAPATIAAKGSSTPLIDTAQLLGAISYEVDMTGRQDPDGHRES